MSTLKAINLVHPTSATNNIVLDSSGNMTAGGTLAMSSSFMRNRIINGAMVIDQRNAGASGTAQAYTVDRWGYYATQASKGTWGQDLGAVASPAGFSDYLGFSSSSAYSVISSDSFIFNQSIEGFNISDFGWGAAGAQSVTLSFWVRSSLTGTHSGSLRNGTVTRSYVFSFTVSAANTWEYKTITIPGDTSGTWIVNNGLGVALSFSLGNGSTYTTTAGAWTAGNFVAATGSVNVVGTNGATFYITGVQLEVGTVATPFEREIYSNTLAKCQRYYQTGQAKLFGYTISTNAIGYQFPFKTSMRTAPVISPSFTYFNAGSGTVYEISTNDAFFQVTATATSVITFTCPFTASAEL